MGVGSRVVASWRLQKGKPTTCPEDASSQVWVTKVGPSFPYSPDSPLPGYSLILGFL